MKYPLTEANITRSDLITRNKKIPPSLPLHHTVKLFLYLFFLYIPGYREFFYQEVFGGVEHPALAEGEFLVVFEDVEAAEDLGYFHYAPAFYLVRVLPVPSVPGLVVEGDSGAGLADLVCL